MKQSMACILVVLMAGCLAGNAPDDPSSEEDPVATDSDAQGPELPSGARHEIFVTGGVEAAGGPAAGECALQPWCFPYSFSLSVPAVLDATLAWTEAGNDFDLVLRDASGVLARTETRTPHTSEALQVELDAGEYEVVVVPYAVVQAEAVLEWTFSPAGAG